MAFSYYVNNAITNYGDYYYQIKELLKVSGWTVTSSSDGLTYSSSTDIITSGGTGAGGMTNTQAWFAISHPSLNGYQRHLCIQVAGAKYQARIKFGWSPFTGGSPGIIQVPTSTDERTIWGSGTDAAPNYTTFIDANTPGNIRCNFISGGAAEGYSFYMLGTKLGAGTPGSLLLMEKFSDSHALDIDPYMYYAGGSSTFPNTGLNNFVSNDFESTSAGPWVWSRKGYTNASFSRSFISWFGTAVGNSGYQAVGQLGTNPYDGSDPLLPMLNFIPVNASSNSSYKGQSSYVRLAGVARTALETNNTKTRIYCGPFSFPWNGSTPVL